MSLLELMLAVLLTSFIFVSLMELYLATKHNFELQTAIASMQERGRFVSYFLRKRIQMAGYAGCEPSLSPIIQNEAIKASKTIGHNPSDALQIKECVWYQQKDQFISTSYFIADHALFAKPSGGTRQEIIEGVDAMQIKYGIQEPNGNVNYFSAHRVKNWSSVVGVAIDLLLRSEKPVLKKPMNYWYRDHLFKAQDRYFYQSWPIVIALRERSLDELRGDN